MNTNPNIARISIHRLGLDVSIGVYAHERFMRQVFVTMVAEIPAALATPKYDRMDEVMNYEALVTAAKKGIENSRQSDGHIHLLETLCQHIASECLNIEAVLGITVRIEKMAAINGVESVSVEIYRQKAG